MEAPASVHGNAHVGSYGGASLHGRAPGPAPADAPRQPIVIVGPAERACSPLLGGGEIGLRYSGEYYQGISEEVGSAKRVPYMATVSREDGERFALLFTLFCCALFSVPIWMTYNIGQDEQVKQWITDMLWLVLLLPALYLVAHVYHVIKSVPQRPLIAVCTLGSAIILMLIAESVRLEAQRLGDVFAARDCSASEGKRLMGEQWAGALTFYSSCVKGTIEKETSIKIETAVNIFRIQECVGYEEYLAQNPSWAYLRSLEEQYLCSGWCYRGPPLWALNATKDSCSAAVADVMYNKVDRTMAQVVVYAIFILGFLAIVLTGPSALIRFHGLTK